MSDSRYVYSGKLELFAPKYAGGYRIGGNSYYTQFNLTRKPIWLHRVMVRLLLGWEWIDAEDKA